MFPVAFTAVIRGFDNAWKTAITSTITVKDVASLGYTVNQYFNKESIEVIKGTTIIIDRKKDIHS